MGQHGPANEISEKDAQARVFPYTAAFKTR
jgi:hypothetical protein